MRRGPYNVDHHVWNYETGSRSRTPRIVVSVNRLIQLKTMETNAYRTPKRKDDNPLAKLWTS